MMKKNIAKLLVFAMLLSMLPFTAAAQTDNANAVIEKVTVGAAEGTPVTTTAGSRTDPYTISVDVSKGAITNPVTLTINLKSESGVIVGYVYKLNDDAEISETDNSAQQKQPSGTTLTDSLTLSDVNAGSAANYAIVLGIGANSEVSRVVYYKLTVNVTAASQSKYAITYTQPENGTLEVKVSGTTVTEAAEGASVTVTATPDAGYTLDGNISVTAGGTPVSGTQSGTSFTFTMPAAAVTVSASFKATTAEEKPVTNITLSESTLSLKAGESKKLTVTYNPTDATDKSVTWTSSNTDVATVDTDGIVKVVDNASVGATTKITATTSNEKTAECTVTVVATPVERVSLNRDNALLTVDGATDKTVQLTATVLPANATDKDVSWSSSDTGKATVSATGLVTAVAKGTAVITATAGGKSATCTVQVKNANDYAIQIDTNTVALTYDSENETNCEKTVTANVGPEGAEVSWESSDPTAVSVTGQGTTGTVATAKVKALKLTDDEVTITATVLDGDVPATGDDGQPIQATCTVNITAAETDSKPVTSITLSPTELNMKVGDEETLAATVLPNDADDKTVSWESGNDAVATVTNGGVVKAVGVGNTTITASAGDQTATCPVTVEAAPGTPTGITLNKTTLSLAPGASEQLTATLTPTGATGVITWESSASAVASVDETGNVTIAENATAGATATITARSGSLKAECVVTVAEDPDLTTKHTVTINEPANGEITVKVGTTEVNTGDKHPEGSDVVVTASPAAGYKLGKLTVKVGSETKESDTAPYTFKLTADAVVSATFVKENYTVSIAEIDTDNGKVMGEVTLAEETKQIGDSVSFTVKAADGYDISSVTATDAAGKDVALIKGENGAYTFTMPGSNVTIKAVFKAKEVTPPTEYTVTVNATPTAGGTAKANVTKAVAGDEIVVTITPAVGYIIDSITNNGVGAAIPEDGKYTFTMPAANVSIAVVFGQLPASVDDVADTVIEPPKNEVPDNAPSAVQAIAAQATQQLTQTKTNLNRVVESLLESKNGKDVGIKGVKETVPEQKITDAKKKLAEKLSEAGKVDLEDLNTVVVPKISISLTGGTATKDGKVNALTFEIGAVAQVMVTTVKDANELTAANSEKAGEISLKDTTEPIEITIPILPEVLENLSNDLVVKHVKNRTTTFYHKAVKTGESIKFTNSRGFSEFTVEDAAGFEAEYNGEYYQKLQEAVDVVAVNGTITVRKNNAKATVSRVITFTLTLGEGVTDVDISAGRGYEVDQSGNTYIFTKESGGGSGGSGGGGGSGSGKPSVKPGETQTPTAPSTTPSGGVAGFNDVAASAWYADAVKYVVDKGLFGGVGNGNFAPNANMTRAMMWTVLARYMGVDTSTGSNWYEAARAWAIEKGISDGTMADGNVTREQFVTMLWRLSGEPAVSNSASFTDSGSVSAYAKTAVDWAVAQGIVNGYNDGSFKPQGSATRAEVAKMLTVFCTNAETAQDAG